MNEDTYEGDITNPLTLNLYTYVGNNPLIRFDPTGHDYQLPSGSRIRQLADNKSYTGMLMYAFNNLKVNQYSGYDNLLNDKQQYNLEELKKVYQFGNGSQKTVAEMQGLALRNDGCSYLTSGCEGGSATIESKNSWGLTISYVDSDGNHSLIEVYEENGEVYNSELIMTAGLVDVGANPKWTKVDSIHGYLTNNGLSINGYGPAQPGMSKLYVRDSSGKVVGEIHTRQPAGRGMQFPRHFQYYLENSDKTDPNNHYYE